ncbi:MAG: PD-(D/E)XK nuclease family protein [Ghiorsea sp.]
MIEEKSTTKDKLFTPILTSELNNKLDQEACLITSNQRLSRFRLGNFEHEKTKAGVLAWETPTILPWSAWLQQQWINAGLGVWLSSPQEALLWRNIILEDEQTQVLNPNALSKQAMEAWKIMADFHIDPDCLQHAGEEHAALLRWGSQVSKKTQHHLQHQILHLLSTAQCNNAPKHIILDGFDSFTPAQTQFFQHLESLGSHIYQTHNNETPALVNISAYPDDESEIRQVCQRIRTIIETQPHHKIGVFIPDLERRAKTVSRIFSEELAPSLSLENNSDLQGEFFNISLGTPLVQQPMIQAALSLLTLSVKHKITYQELSHLLLNPYIMGHDEESHQRARLDAQLRKSNQGQLTLGQFLKYAEESDAKTPLFQAFITVIVEHQSLHQSFSGKNILSSWTQLAESILSQLQWHTQLLETNARETSQLQNWQDLLFQISSLDDFYGLIRWSEALACIHEQASEHVFRPAPGQANIQVMGMLEAANLRFDFAFILGMDDMTWPPAAKPHPLIPFDIQTQHQTPHANSEREWLYAQTVWQNLQSVSPTIVVSYATSKDKQDVQVSPLLQDLESLPHTDLKPSQRYAFTLQQHQAQLRNTDEYSMPITNTEEIRGGTGILKSQSACAFQAFARYRLNLSALEEPCLGLSAAEQGTLLHSTLETFWNHTKSSENLLQMIQGDTLEKHIIASIQKAWKDLHRLVANEIKILEEKRLKQLIHTWLHMESKREPFNVIATETWKNISLGTAQALTLHTKFDRVDATANGHQVILDYKTGLSSPTKSLGIRPDEPQLPAYYIAEKDLGVDVSSVAVAQVRQGDCSFKGFAQEADILPHIKTYKGKKDQPDNWDELTAHWQETLDQLADQFLSGSADITPKNSQSCTYCQFSGLCRIKQT